MPRFYLRKAVAGMTPSFPLMSPFGSRQPRDRPRAAFRADVRGVPGKFLRMDLIDKHLDNFLR